MESNYIMNTRVEVIALLMPFVTAQCLWYISFLYQMLNIKTAATPFKLLAKTQAVIKMAEYKRNFPKK